MCGTTKAAITALTSRRHALAATATSQAAEPASVPDGDRDYLDLVYARLRPPASSRGDARVQRGISGRAARRQREAEQEQRVAAAEHHRRDQVFTGRWPDAAPDSSGDVDRCGGDYAALHEEITARRLPEAMHRFQTMISEDMVPSVSVLYRAIETARRRSGAAWKWSTPGCGGSSSTRAPTCRSPGHARQFDSVRQFRRAVDDLLAHVAGRPGRQRAGAGPVRAGS